MRMTRAGIICLICSFVALAAAATTLGIEIDVYYLYDSRYEWTWLEIVVVSCSSLACLEAISAMLFQLMRSCQGCACSRPASPACIIFCLIGLAAHTGMLVCVTIEYSRDIYFPNKNFFNYFDSWGAKLQAQYIFGLGIGCLFWIFAFLAAVADWRAAKDSSKVYTAPTAQQGQGSFIASNGSPYAVPYAQQGSPYSSASPLYPAAPGAAPYPGAQYTGGAARPEPVSVSPYQAGPLPEQAQQHQQQQQQQQQQAYYSQPPGYGLPPSSYSRPLQADEQPSAPPASFYHTL